jgi:nondiscriminating aspartyl-tRNA synthetase
VSRTLALETKNKVGKKVTLLGWVYNRRDHGKLIFIDLLDRSGLVQLVCSEDASDLRAQDVIKATGEVKEREKKNINPELSTGAIEVKVSKIEKLAEAEELPFDTAKADLDVELPTLLDYRPLTLRHPKVKAIFEVQEVIIDSFRKTLKELDFTEFQPPYIVPSATEGGAEIFPIEYYDKKAFLGQSPQLYKQIMVGVFERVMAVARAYRAEPSETTRHLSEYISLDCEMGFIEDWEELLETAEKVILGIFDGVKKNSKDELKLYNAKIPRYKTPFPRLKLQEAQEIIQKEFGRDVKGEPDLSPEDEADICSWSEKKRGSEMIFITHFPAKKRPFYVYPDPEDEKLTLSFDLLGRGVEWITGGQRIHEYEKLVGNIKKWGNNPQDFRLYLQAFKYGMPPHGGFAIGAERVTMQILGLSNIREASLFPRDMKRVDFRLSE